MSKAWTAAVFLFAWKHGAHNMILWLCISQGLGASYSGWPVSPVRLDVEDGLCDRSLICNDSGSLVFLYFFHWFQTNGPAGRRGCISISSTQRCIANATEFLESAVLMCRWSMPPCLGLDPKDSALLYSWSCLHVLKASVWTERLLHQHFKRATGCEAIFLADGNGKMFGVNAQKDLANVAMAAAFFWQFADFFELNNRQV